MSYGYPPHDPYGGYGVPGHPNQYGPYGPPPPVSGNGPALAALIANIALTVLCCGIFALPGIITAAVAMSRWHTDNRSARNLVTWSWVIFGLSIALMIVSVVVLFGFGVWDSMQNNDQSYYDDDRAT